MRRPLLQRLQSLLQRLQPLPQAPTLGARTSIASQLRWSYLISSTIPLLVVGALILSISSRTQQNNVYNDQRNLASRMSRTIARYVSEIYSEVEEYATLVRPGDGTQVQWQLNATNLQQRNYQRLVGIAVLDSSGHELLRVKDLLPVPSDSLADLSQDRSVQLALQEGLTTFSPIALDDSNIPTFTVTLPLLNNAGTIIGVLRAEISARPITEELLVSTRGSNSYAYLIDSTTGAVLISDGRPDFVVPPQIDVLLRAEQDTAEYIGARRQDVVGSIAPISLLGRDIATGWSVVVEQPAAVAFASVGRSILILTLLVILVGALALMWAFRQARQILQPLAALRSGAMALGTGQLSHRIVPPRDDELGDLARAFNQMADHLQQSLAEIERQNEHLRRGLALARDIQVGLLPDRAPWNGDTIDVYARSIPAYEVGGDFYTYLALAEGRGAIAIGDISGKGVGAALLMALTSSAVETQGRQIEHPAQVLTALNHLLAPRLRANHMNAALLFAVLDPRERVLRVANAGMIAPVMISSQGNYFVEVGGLPVGSFVGAIYQEQVIKLNPGDALLLVSDGVVEAHNAQGELFGFDRLEAAVAEASAQGNVRMLVERVLERVQEFMGDAEQHDDITLVAIRPAIAAEQVFPSDDKEQSITYATV